MGALRVLVFASEAETLRVRLTQLEVEPGEQRVLAVAASGEAEAVLPYGRWRLEVLFEEQPLGVYVLEDSTHGCTDFHGSKTQVEIEHRPEVACWNTWVGFLVTVRVRDRQEQEAITAAEFPNLTTNEVQRRSGGEVAFWVSALKQGSYPHYVQAAGYARRLILTPQPTRPLAQALVVELEREQLLEGILRDEKGSPLPEGSKVSFHLGEREENCRVGGHWFRAQVRTGGRFRIENLPPGPVQGQFQARDWGRGRSGGTWSGSTPKVSGEVDLRLEAYVPPDDD